MEYQVIDSSGTDDDLPPSHYNAVSRGDRVTGNGRSVINSAPYQMMHSDMETQIHKLEQEAYGAILRAFKAQSDALTWEKEGLITDLRKELRVSDDEHRDQLARVNADDLILRIREWRKAGENHNTMLNRHHPVLDPEPSPTVLGSRKKQKSSQSVTLPFGTPSQLLRSQSIAATTLPSSPAANWGPVSGTGGKSRPYPSTGPRGHLANHGSSGALLTNELAETTCDPLIGSKVMTRWPGDNNFYEAVIRDFNPVKGQHALVYGRNTPNETWQWVDLKDIPPEDIKWEGDDTGISRRGGSSGQGFGVRNATSRGVVPSAEKDFQPSQNGVVKKVSDEIEIRNTDTLIKEVEKVVGASHPDLFEIEKAKKMLKEHEQVLIDVIAKLADISDNESDGEQPLLMARDQRLMVQQ